MRFATLYQIPLQDLMAMADGTLENTITDLDFLETLAHQKCLLVPPFLVQTSADGKLTQIAPLIYTMDGQLDKPRVLLALARALREQRANFKFRRFKV